MEIKELLKIIHDAQILSIQAGAEDQLLVEIKTDLGLKLKMEFLEVKLFRFTDFVKENVISKLNFFNLNDHTNHDIEYYLKWVTSLSDAEYYLKWLTSLSDAESYLNTESVEKFINQIRMQELQLIYFEPSCGVEGVVLYKSLLITEIL